MRVPRNGSGGEQRAVRPIFRVVTVVWGWRPAPTGSNAREQRLGIHAGGIRRARCGTAPRYVGSVLGVVYTGDQRDGRNMCEHSPNSVS